MSPNDTTATVALVEAARAVRARAYVPYSKFRAGAAVRADDGSIVPGVIVENVSLGLAMCAERVALHATVAQGLRPVALALVAPGTAGKLTWPCGACLQVALELGGPELAIAVAPAASDDAGSIVTATLGELLPNGPHKR
jgi:cytidine deaminase